jgi:hypothetical protein
LRRAGIHERRSLPALRTWNHLTMSMRTEDPVLFFVILATLLLVLVFCTIAALPYLSQWATP